MLSEASATLDPYPGATLDADGWVNLGKAAAQLGISLDAMRRRMR